MPDAPQPEPTAQNETDVHQRLEAIGEKLAGVLHDLGGPLGVIQGFAELMAEESDEAARKEFLNEILLQVHRITDLREETLAFARGQRSLLRRVVHMHELSKRFAAVVDRELSGTALRSEVTATYKGPVLVDDDQLLRAVENLARNAREAMVGTQGTHFAVHIEQRGRELVLSFSDDGPGIPPAMRGHCFERFGTWGKANGHGLGLANVKAIAVRHGGAALCFSQPGHGTRFELHLPVLPPDSAQTH